MPDTTTRPRRLREHAALAGLVLGAVFGLTFVLASSRAVAERQIGSSHPVLDATHVPPLLTTDGEDIALRYDVHCASEGEGTEDTACDARGTVFVRAGMFGEFQEIPLTIDKSAAEGRHVATVPARITNSGQGFSYYAVFGADGRCASVTLPGGGAEAPHRSLPLGRAVEVRLGRHDFGRARKADARVAEADWGEGVAEVGLEGGVNVAPVGGSSFDVDGAGSILLLDQVNRRVLRWTPKASAPTQVPVSIDGTIADLAVASTGTMYVLEGGRASRPAALRTFDRSGRTLSVAELAERTATQVRVGPKGALVLQHPSGQWLPAATADDTPLSALTQARAGRAGRLLPNGDEVIVLRTGNEIRLALANEHRVRRAWRITSTLPLAEVQLAEPMPGGLLVVFRVYSETDDEFVALVLGSRGLRARMSLDSADWAESAPLSRFKLSGSSLYQLGSTRAGVFVDRFDLEVK